MIRFYKEFTDTADDACFYGTGSPVSDAGAYGPMLVNIWQHVVTVFKQHGATNVQWIWGPSANLFSNRTSGPDDKNWRYFYPGSNFVDWISNDNYNKSDTTAADYGADPDIANWYSLTSPLGKPLMQAETGAGYPDGGVPDGGVDPMATWISTAYTTVETQRPAMKAFVWWSSDGQVDYNLQGQGLSIYIDMAKDPYFQATDATPYFSSTGAAGGSPTPTGFTATPHAAKVSLSWTASANATSYTVYRDGVVIGAPTATTFNDPNVTSGATYNYSIDAIDAAFDRSLPSAEVPATVP
jgi:hypothetical protein